MVDNIVEEIHAIREKIFEECNCDSEKLADYCLKLQEDAAKKTKSTTEEIQRIEIKKPLDQ